MINENMHKELYNILHEPFWGIHTEMKNKINVTVSKYGFDLNDDDKLLNMLYDSDTKNVFDYKTIEY